MARIRPVHRPLVLLCLLIANHGLLEASPTWGQAPAVEDPADLVDPLIGTAASRWIFFSSACRPFGMVNLSPDTKVGGDWLNGYVYGENRVRCFSHLHGWQLYGIPVMPQIGKLCSQGGLDAAASPFDHREEVVHPGYHKLFLNRYGITAELTSTTRVGFHRYTFPESRESYIAIDTGARLMDKVESSSVHQVHPDEFAGKVVMAVTERRPKTFTVYFVARFSKPVEFGGWKNGQIIPRTIAPEGVSGTGVGAYASFSSKAGEKVMMKVAVSYTSEDAARRNLEEELPGWDFDAVVNESRKVWNDWLGRIAVEGGSRAQKVKFYTDLWHVLLGRRIVSDVDGSYADNTGDQTRIRKVPLREDGRPRFPHYNFDALWGSQWSLNILWSFAYPEVMDGFCSTLVDMYRDGGLIPRGPSGGNYTFVMIGDPAASFISAAYSKGIRGYDVGMAYEGLIKNALPGGIRDHAGYEFATNACGGGMAYYVERGYVPEGIPGVGMHRDGASMTLEYAYQDWCLSQLARSLGHDKDAEWLALRSGNYRNLWDSGTGWMRPRNTDGSWLSDFSPVDPKNSFHTKGFCEANSAICTYGVPQDLNGLISLFGGRENFVRRLNEQFEAASPQNFVAPHGKHGGAWVDYDNEPSFEMAHLFNLAGRPDLSQKWVREILSKAYGGTTPESGYKGDEDQGQMGALGVLMAIGLFDVRGGSEIDPDYQITSPVFNRITIRLNKSYFPGEKFTITTRNNSPSNDYIQSATLDGKPLKGCSFSHRQLVAGGDLQIELGPKPRSWGTESASQNGSR